MTHRDPMTPAMFHILLALADGPQHGYAIMQDVLARTDGAVDLGTGTLYRAIRRLVDDGFIQGTKSEDDRRSWRVRSSRGPRSTGAGRPPSPWTSWQQPWAANSKDGTCIPSTSPSAMA